MRVLSGAPVAYLTPEPKFATYKGMCVAHGFKRCLLPGELIKDAGRSRESGKEDLSYLSWGSWGRMERKIKNPHFFPPNLGKAENSKSEEQPTIRGFCGLFSLTE